MRFAELGICLLLAPVAVGSARAQLFSWSGQATQGSNGHYYALVTEGPDFHCGQYTVYGSAWAFARTLRFNGWPGHVITLNSLAEFADPVVRGLLGGGWVAATGSGTSYTHDDGPEFGQPVNFFGHPLFQYSFGASCPGYQFPRLRTNGSAWYSAPDLGIFCDVIVCTAVPSQFVVEFEPDLTVPVIGSLSFDPSGADMLVGSSVLISWLSSDAWAGIAAVRLLLSRTGSDGPFEEIASGLPPGGSYLWQVSGPATPRGMAIVAVEARDVGGNVSTLKSAPNTITAPTPAVRTSWGKVKSRYR